MRAALFGNQNSGKTTLFNYLTGNNAHTGNYPGITVEVQEGKILSSKILLADLPGIYSLSFRSREEEISAEFLKTKPDVIINILDGNCIARGLYLTFQLMEYGIPMIIVLNMMDEVRKKGNIDISGLENALGVPVLPVSARSGEGCKKIIGLLNKGEFKTGKSKWSRGTLTGEKAAEFYYKNIDSLMRFVHIKEDYKISFADRLLTGKITGPVCFALIIGAILYLTFAVFGKFLTGFIEYIFGIICSQADILLENLHTAPFLRGLICDGILAGTGSIISFLPCVLILFFFLGLLEDSGYMARVAFIMDEPMRRSGLSGKAIVPLIMGTGCSVPALLACRTMEENRKNTALSVPFIPCSARLPIYFMFATKFFTHPFLVISLLYISGFFAAFVSGAVSSKGAPPPFLMELAPYRLPKIGTVFKNMCDKAFDFIKRTFTVIMLAGIFVYLLSNLSLSLKPDPDNSILYLLSKFLLPAFSLMGLTSWQCVAALISGISAKEAILSTFSVLGVTTDIFTPASALAFLFFCTLYTPCIAALSLIKKEYGIKAMLKSILSQTLTAYAAGVAVYFIARMIL